jgi:hypothetical protein
MADHGGCARRGRVASPFLIDASMNILPLMTSSVAPTVDSVKLGLFAINYGTCADPDVAIEVARHAEECGFESVWSSEHVAFPDPRPEELSFLPTLPLLDTVVALTLIAAHCTPMTRCRYRFGVGYGLCKEALSGGEIAARSPGGSCPGNAGGRTGGGWASHDSDDRADGT